SPDVDCEKKVRGADVYAAMGEVQDLSRAVDQAKAEPQQTEQRARSQCIDRGLKDKDRVHTATGERAPLRLLARLYDIIQSYARGSIRPLFSEARDDYSEHLRISDAADRCVAGGSPAGSQNRGDPANDWRRSVIRRVDAQRHGHRNGRSQ